MISFIIIGRNEGWKLSKCLESIFKTIKINDLTNYEIIYVDSNSTDDSIERAKRFEETKIFQLTGDFNAAIARNIGAKESVGGVLFFIDGDMEIMPEFLSNVYNEKKGLKYPFVSGQLKNFNYDETGNFINNTWLYSGVLIGDKYYSTTGGIFLIKREPWFSVKGMDLCFKRGEDLDLGLRLAKVGYKVLRKKEVVANHYTVAYTHHSRMWETIFSGDVSYANSFLMRKHFLNYYVYLKMFRNYYTLFSLIAFGALAIIFNSLYFLSGYIGILAVKTIKAHSRNVIRILELLLYYAVRDLAFIYYLFVPMRKINSSEIQYIQIQ